MISIILAALLGLSWGTIHSEKNDKSLMRDLIIILDEDTETNPSKGGACTLALTKALMAESTPFLVNASLWQVFLELRQEWSLGSQMPDTDLYNVAQYLNAINERINYWYSILKDTNVDELRIRSLITEKINEEFFTKEKCKELQDTYKLPSNCDYGMVLCARFATRYDFNAWYWFYLNTGYYLAIPKKYAAHYTGSSSYTDTLNACGFSPLTSNIDPLCIDPIQNLQLPPIEDSIISTLKNLFTPDKRFTWFLFVNGHGCCYKLDNRYRQKITGVDAEKFREMCQWFNTNLVVHTLWIRSCGAGGLNRLYLQAGMQKYHYNSVIESVGDFFTRAAMEIRTLNPKANPLFYCTRGYIRRGPDAQWELWYDGSESFAKFFDKMHTLDDTTKPIQDCIYDISEVMTPGVYIENTPYLSLPYSDKWLLCCPSHRTLLDVQAALLAEVCNMPHLLHTRTVLIDTPILKTGLKIVDKDVEYVVIITPDESTHYIGPVDASEMKLETFINCFWPITGQYFIKHVLLESVIFQCDSRDKLAQILGITEKTVIFKNVLMRIVKNEQIEFVFTVPSGEVFYATFRAVDGKKPMVRNLQKLSATATASYRTYYDKTKSELLAKTDEAYAPLRNHYLQAMKKDQKQEQAAVA